MRQGNLDLAESELTHLIENDREGSLSQAAKRQLETVKRLRENEVNVVKTPERQVSPQEFLKTKAAQYFMSGQYQKALEELHNLEKMYPEDLLIARYVGITQDKLKRYDEALLTFQATLKIAPDNIPLHYSMAQTLLHKKDFEGAKGEFQYVADRDETGAYRSRAVREVEGVQRIIDYLKRAKPKKWTLNASGGAEYNTNATSESRIPGFGSQEHQSAWKFSNSAGGSYEFWRKDAWSIKGTYNYSHAFYSDSLSQLNVISNGAGANATYIKNINGKLLFLQIAQTTYHNIVRDDYYSTIFVQSITGLFQPKDWYRLISSYRLLFTSYDKEGTEPDITSRDGLGNAVSLTNNFYFNKPKTLYYLLGAEVQRDDTQGVDYIKNAFSIRTGFHFPIIFKCEGEIGFRFKESEFPKFSAPVLTLNTEPERRDEEYNFDIALTRKINDQWTLNAYYRLIMTDSQNDLYTYTNNALGFILSYNY